LLTHLWLVLNGGNITLQNSLCGNPINILLKKRLLKDMPSNKGTQADHWGRGTSGNVSLSDVHHEVGHFDIPNGGLPQR